MLLRALRRRAAGDDLEPACSSKKFKSLQVRSLDERWHQIRGFGLGHSVRVQIGRLLFSELQNDPCTL